MKIISKDKKQKIKSVHHSIKTQMITSFVGLLICLVVTLIHQRKISGAVLYK
jgi:hypothetical protein